MQQVGCYNIQLKQFPMILLYNSVLNLLPIKTKLYESYYCILLRAALCSLPV